MTGQSWACFITLIFPFLTYLRTQLSKNSDSALNVLNSGAPQYENCCKTWVWKVVLIRLGVWKLIPVFIRGGVRCAVLSSCSHATARSPSWSQDKIQFPDELCWQTWSIQYYCSFFFWIRVYYIRNWYQLSIRLLHTLYRGRSHGHANHI